MNTGALIGLGVIILFIVLVLSALPNKKYTCSKCGFETLDETTAAGHTATENTHKMI